MGTGYTERDMILSLIKSDYGRSGGWRKTVYYTF